MYTFHAFVKKQYAACVFCLLPDKKEATYKAMLDLVINLAAAESIVLSPSVIHADLEVAPINAFRSRFPEAQLMACQFHVAKAWWSHMQEYGLSTMYKQINSDESKWLKLFFGLPALPPDKVENCFAFTLMSQKPNSSHQGIDHFVDYILSTYILPDSMYPPSLWANEAVVGRTTNACENFHRHFQDNFPSAYPNIFLFLDILEKEQQKIQLKIRTIEPTAPKRRKTKTKEERKDYLLTLYKTHQITQIEFLTNVANEMLPVVF